MHIMIENHSKVSVFFSQKIKRIYQCVLEILGGENQIDNVAKQRE